MFDTASPGQGPADWLAPGRTALVLIDMQADFASPDGALGKAGLDLSGVPPVLAASERMLDAARAAGVTVVFVGLQTRADLDSPAWAEWNRRRGAPAGGGLCRQGEPGSAFYGPQPVAGELVIPKLRYSSFFGTSLDAALRARRIDTLVVCGLTTECCVDCTVRDAFHLDYHVFIAQDACGAYDPATHESALANLALNCAILVDAEDVAAAWSQAAQHATTGEAGHG